MKPPFGMYQTEAMIYLHANRLYHVLPLVSTKTFREGGYLQWISE